MTGVPVELDRMRELRFGTNALCILEDKLGKQLGEILSQGMGISMIRLVFWAGLVWDDKELTEESAGLLMDDYMAKGHGFDDVTNLIRDGLLKSGFVDPADVEAIEKAAAGEEEDSAPLA